MQFDILNYSDASVRLQTLYDNYVLYFDSKATEEEKDLGIMNFLDWLEERIHKLHRGYLYLIHHYDNIPEWDYEKREASDKEQLALVEKIEECFASTSDFKAWWNEQLSDQ